MGRKKELSENPQSTNWKLLLYPDNQIHSEVMQKLQTEFLNESLWIEHLSYDLDGHMISEGQGKPHFHFALKFDKPVRLGSLCKKIGLVDDGGLPDSQFIRVVSGRFDKWLVYLTHLSQPDKEQYDSSALHGSPVLRAMYEKAALDYMSSELTTRDCVRACLEWINRQGDRLISMQDFSWWIISSPYFKARSDRLVISCIQEHNDRIYAQKRQETISSFSGYTPIQQVSNGLPEGLFDTEWENL